MSKPIKLNCGQTNFDEKIVKTIWVKKKFLIIKSFGLKKILGQKFFGSNKNFGQQNIWVKIFFVQKKFCSKNFIFRVKKNLGSKKFSDQ